MNGMHNDEWASWQNRRCGVVASKTFALVGSRYISSTSPCKVEAISLMKCICLVLTAGRAKAEDIVIIPLVKGGIGDYAMSGKGRGA